MDALCFLAPEVLKQEACDTSVTFKISFVMVLGGYLVVWVRSSLPGNWGKALFSAREQDRSFKNAPRADSFVSLGTSGKDDFS